MLRGEAAAPPGPAGRRLLHPVLWTALTIIWVSSVGVGLAWLMAYDNTPGLAADAPREWPTGTALTRDATGPTLLMLAHPRCDCTRASLGELAELLARAHSKPKTFIVFIKPGGVGAAWEQTALWHQAEAIPDVTVIRDDDGSEARRFGVVTSGQTLLYDRDGRLVYAGGMTGGRGRPGANLGRATLLAALAGDRPPRATAGVFGCSLFSWSTRKPEVQADGNGS